MATFLAGLAALIALILLVLLIFRPQSRRSEPVPDVGMGRGAAGTVGQSRGRGVQPDAHLGGWVHSDSSSEYYVRPGSSAHVGSSWDPYSEKMDLKERFRAARRRPRPVRPGGHPNYYALLGVEPSANDREIELAYRKRVAAMHPDRHFTDPGKRREAEVALKHLNAAVDVLRDPIRRSRYDASI